MDNPWLSSFRPNAPAARDDGLNHPTWRSANPATAQPEEAPASAAEPLPTAQHHQSQQVDSVNSLISPNPNAPHSLAPSMAPMTQEASMDDRGLNPVADLDRNATPESAPMKRTGSNLSSTSSDILVAPGPPSEPRPQPPVDMKLLSPAAANIWADGRRILVVRLTPERLRGVLSRPPVKAEVVASPLNPPYTGDSNHGGPNARGTYSKDYILQHPEITWVHRGQGRYLPSSAVKSESSPALTKPSRFSRPVEPSEDPFTSSQWSFNSIDSQTPQKSQQQHQIVNGSQPNSQSATPAEGQSQKRRRRPVEETLTDSLTPAPVYGLRRRVSEQQQSPNTGEQRSARLARRARAFPSIEDGRRSSRTTQYSEETDRDTDEDEDDEDDDEDVSMGDEGEERHTFDKAWVDAHPEEQYHHTGNGWYKRGRKPRGPGKRTKARDSEDGISRTHDGSWQFDPDKTVHHTQLDKFPGYEFYHAGNGWYKSGPAPSAKKTSIIVPFTATPDSSREGYGFDQERSFTEDGDGPIEEGLHGKYSKEYTLLHPEIDWVHRGNGRYVIRDANRDYTPASSFANSNDRRSSKGDSTFDKAYVDSHPDDPFYHTGNGRYKRGVRPSRKSSMTRDEIEDALDPDGLYDRAFVEAHPQYQFHHRGQGRYKLGPREARQPQGFEDEDPEPEGLVDTEYVDSHPNETFYHKGQGRWARGLPPPGASNKTAVRGPDAKGHSASAGLTEDEDDMRGAPALTALVLKSDGPDKFPDLKWNYRGGGKWSRVTKQQFEEISNPRNYVPATFSRKSRGRNAQSDGPGAQLERETVRAADYDQDGYTRGYRARGNAMEDRPAVKRRRRTKNGAYNTQDDDSSKGASKPPTPRPQQLKPEEDILSDSDLPGLYRGSHSPPDPDRADEAGRLYRKHFSPLNTDSILKSLLKHDPAVRPTDVLKRLAANAQAALMGLQDEYLDLERITAPHAKIPRKPAKGGRLPVDSQIFEDRKEADLYDYLYDGRRVGYQDADAQKIVRDAEGRELRKRRQRNGPDTVPGWDFGDGPEVSSKRASRQPTRFDGSAAPSTRRRQTANNTAAGTASVTPERAATPVIVPASAPAKAPAAPTVQVANGYEPPKTGRWAGHIPKRIRELRDESVGTSRGSDKESKESKDSKDTASQSSASASASGEPKPVRKGRPPGSKNHHKRKDAGIKKGPRKKPNVPLTEAQRDAELQRQAEIAARACAAALNGDPVPMQQLRAQLPPQPPRHQYGDPLPPGTHGYGYGYGWR